MTIEEYCLKKRKESMNRHREKMRKEGRCLYCGKEDAYTIIGKIRCFDCTEKERIRKIQYRKDIDVVERDRKKREERKNKRIEEGKCPLCGRINSSIYKYCQYCRSKDKIRKQKNRIMESFTRGTILCWQCNKEEPVEGKKLCATCYERALRNIEIANNARMKKKIYPYWSGKNIVDKQENV